MDEAMETLFLNLIIIFFPSLRFLCVCHVKCVILTYMYISIPISYIYHIHIPSTYTCQSTFLNTQSFKINFSVSFNRQRDWHIDFFLQWLNKAQLRNIRGANTQNQEDDSQGHDISPVQSCPSTLSFCWCFIPHSGSQTEEIVLCLYSLGNSVNFSWWLSDQF